MVHAPASTSNLGPGFDALGLALDFGLLVRATAGAPGSGTHVEIRGEGAGELATDEANLIAATVRKHLLRRQIASPDLELAVTNAIPIARGLGASAAARVAGHLIAAHIVGERLAEGSLVDLVSGEEGHPDNAAPCILGGLVAATGTGMSVAAVRLPWPEDLAIALLIPRQTFSTDAARAVLPWTVPHSDAVHNVGRTALLVAALATGSREHLALATADKLHQPYRLPLINGWETILVAARRAGALGAFISGAGSTVAAFCEVATANAIADAMAEAAVRAELPATTRVAMASTVGARVSTDA